MRTTESRTGHPAATPPDRSRAPGALTRAWLAIVLIPVFFFIALGVGEGVISLLGYTAGAGNAPIWVSLVSDLAAITACLIPCLAAVFFGRRAYKADDRRGLFPVVLGTVVGLGWLILTIVTEVADQLR
jgi:fatty acid desaturase